MTSRHQKNIKIIILIKPIINRKKDFFKKKIKKERNKFQEKRLKKTGQGLYVKT